MKINKLNKRAAVSLLCAWVMVLCFAMTGSVFANKQSAGTEFWLAFPDNAGANGRQLSLSLGSAVNTSASINVPGLGFTTNFTVTAGAITKVVIPIGAAVSATDGIVNRGVHVTSANNVSVFGMNSATVSSDSYVGFPVPALGKDYIVLAYGNGGLAGSQFTVVGTQPNTAVTITPSVTTGTRVGGNPYVITLNQGEVYQLRNTVGNNAANDLTGTIISADKPVGVFGGHYATRVPSNVNSADHLVEQLPPTRAWGKTFATMPLATRLAGDRFRFLASAGSTQVKVNGGLVATLNRGQFYEMTIGIPAHIEADKPILVAQYAQGNAADGVTKSDPFMAIVPWFEQYISDYIVAPPDVRFTNYVNLTAPAAIVGSITLDGNPITSSFVPIGASGFSGASVPISFGSHRLTAPQPFSVLSYGWASTESYGTAGGMNLSPVADLNNLSLSPNNTTSSVGDQHCVVALVTDIGNNPLDGVRVDFKVTGVNNLTAFAFADANGMASFCYENPTGSTGTDTIQAAVGSFSSSVSHQWGFPGQPSVVPFASVITNAITASGTPVTSVATISDAEGNPLQIDWYVDGVLVQSSTIPAGQSISPSSVSLTHNYSAGIHNVTLVISDGQTTPVTISRTVKVLDTEPPVITLQSPLTIVKGTAFVDPGVTAIDNVDGNISANVVASGTVDINVVGTYLVTYTVSDSSGNVATATRRVNVIDPFTLSIPTLTDYTGTNYWLAFPANYDVLASTLTLFIASEKNTLGTVFIRGLNFTTNFTVTAGVVTSITIPSNDALDLPGVVQDLGIHVTSADDILVYGLNREPVTSDAYLGLPYESLSTEHFIMSYRNGHFFGGTQFAIVGAEDNTTVTFALPVDTVIGANTFLAGVPYNLTLNAGQTYLIRNSEVSAAGDLTGSFIVSDKPVAVFGSHKAANVPFDINAADHLVEQMPPTRAWGRSFVTMPLAGRNGDTFRFLASEDGTVVSINGVPVATLNRGKFHEQVIFGPAEISATAPVIAAQYSNGTFFENPPVQYGDPFMMLLPWYEQFLDAYTFATPTAGFPVNYINITVNSTAVGAIKLDGVPIPASSFVHIGNSVFSGVQVPISSGQHRVTSPLPFGLYIYGFGSTESYGYPGGMNVSSVGLVRGLTLTPKTATFPVGTVHCLEAYVGGKTNEPIAGIRVDFAVSGANPVLGFGYSDTNGIAKFCYVGSNCSGGNDTISASVGIVTDTASAMWTPPPNRPPVVVTPPHSATVEAAGPLTPVTLSAQVADPDCRNGLLVTWELNGSVAQVGNVPGGNGVAPSGTVLFNHSYPVGTSTVTGNVSDGEAAPVPFGTTVTVTIVDTTAPALTLIGGVSLTHNAGDPFVDPGATAFDLAGGDLTSQIVVTGTVNPNVPGAYVLTYSIRDASGNTATATRTVTVVDGPPVITISGSNPLNHEAGTPYADPGATANDYFDGNLTSAIVVSSNVNPNVPGTYTVTYQVQDSQGHPATATRTVNVFDGPPLITLIGANPITISQGGTFADPGATAGDLVDGNLTGAIVTTSNVDPNVPGTYTVTYTVKDSAGNTASVTRSVIVVQNHAPVTSNLNVTTLEDTAVGGQVNATDADGDPLAFALGTGPAHGAVVVNVNGMFTYTPAANYNGLDSFTVLVSDGNGGTATATVAVNVTPVNDPPVASNVSLTTAEDTSVSGVVTATDVDGDALAFTLGAAPAHGTVVLNANRTFTYTPTADYNGPDSFTVTVSDGNGGTITITVSLTVTPVDDVPVAVADSATTLEDTPVTTAVLGNDLGLGDGGIVVTFATQPLHGTTVVNPNGTITYTPAADYNGSDSYNYTVMDIDGQSSTATVAVNVMPVNDPPVAVADSYNLAGGATLVVAPPQGVLANDTDVDADTLQAAVLSTTAHGLLTLNADGSFSYVPVTGFVGTDTFNYTANDTHGGSAVATVTVTVLNNPPVAGNLSLMTLEDTEVGGQVVASDADGDTLTFVLGAGSAHGTVGVNPNGTFTYTPAANYNGPDGFTVTVSDTHGGTTTVTVSVNVTPVNDPPVASGRTVTTSEDTAVSGQVPATDVDGDALAFTLGAAPTHGTVVVNPDGTFTYTPAANYNGLDSFTMVVSDGKGGTTTATVAVNVMPVNDPPVAGNVSLTTAEDTAVSGQVPATDVDGDALAFTLGAAPAHGTVVLNPGGTFTYTPAVNFNGTDSFTVIVSDGHGGTTAATVSVTVTPVNDPPVAVNDTATTSQGAPVTINVLANDIDLDGDVLAVASVTQAAHGTVAISANGTVTYTPSAGFSGSDAFTYAVSDGQGGTATGTVTVTVQGVAGGCDLYPIALHIRTLRGIQVGAVVEVFNGANAGNFGWLTWAGSPSIPTLVASLTPPGNSRTYVNPHKANDHSINIGDYVQGRPGVGNSSQVRAALDVLKMVDITVPVWDEVECEGNNANYRVTRFALIQIVGYSLPSGNKNPNVINARFLGFTDCGGQAGGGHHGEGDDDHGKGGKGDDDHESDRDGKSGKSGDDGRGSSPSKGDKDSERRGDDGRKS